SVYELDKSALIAAADGSSCPKPVCAPRPHRLSLKNAFKLACGNMRCKYGRLSAAILSLLIASTLLLVTVSGAISGTGQSAFDDLFATYGQSILDLSVVDNFTSAGGTDGAENDAPSADVSQDIDGLYEKYLSDARVSHIVFTQAFNDIKIKHDGQDYTIKTSNTMPSVNELTAGVMPMGDGHEVVVPQSFVRTLGITDEAAIGKTISFSGAVYNWDSGNPVSLPVHTEAKIVGVVDTTVKYDSGGQVFEYSVDDSFFFSKSALHEMQLQAKINSANTDFTIRAKTPAELIAIKDELNASGIVPIGRFELIEDMVRLNEQTRNQSGYATIIIAILSLVTALSVALMAALSR
ncbi:MAG: macrolide ABC transporter ATP-binding protein/permease, partial [Clostridia bacterium]